MATLTASSFLEAPRSLPSGNVTRTGSYTTGAVAIEASAQTIFLCKIPNHATIVDCFEHHTTGATSCPMDFGIDATLSAFVTQGTQGVINRRSVVANTPYTISLSDSAVAQYGILKATPVAPSATTSFKLNWSVTYTMDG